MAGSSISAISTYQNDVPNLMADSRHFSLGIFGSHDLNLRVSTCAPPAVRCVITHIARGSLKCHNQHVLSTIHIYPYLVPNRNLIQSHLQALTRQNLLETLLSERLLLRILLQRRTVPKRLFIHAHISTVFIDMLSNFRPDSITHTWWSTR